MKSFLIFVGGLVIGGSASWVYHKNKYEKQMNEEFKEAREYRKKQRNMKKEVDKKTDEIIRSIDEEEKKENLKEAKTIINYNNYSTKDNVESCPDPVKKPFVVTPQDFASQPGYDVDTYYIFENDIIADCDNNMLDDVTDVLGLTAIEIRNQFGVYEEDSVFIRNEALKMDYEILRELSTYVKKDW